MSCRRWVLLTGAVVGLACGDANGVGEESVSVVDSAGVRIVEDGRQAGLESRLRLSSEPLFRVGWQEGEPSFERVYYGAVMDDGRYAVTEQARVTVIDGSGEEVYSLGQVGEGPGEFSMIWSVIAAGGDTLIIHDWDLGRVTTFAGEDLINTELVTPPIIDHRHVVRGRGPGGELLLVPTGSLNLDGPSDEWLPVGILRYRYGAPGMDTIARLDFQMRRRGAFVAPINWSVGARTTWIHARADRPELRWYDYEGNLRQVARWKGEERVLTDSTWTRIEELAKEVRSYREMPEKQFQERVSSWKEGPQGPIPVYGALYADAAGNVWLGEWTPFGRNPQRFTLVGSDGIVQGRLQVPEGFEVLAFGEDVVLGVERDPLDVPAVSAYAIEREP